MGLGKRIAISREKVGISREELANKLGLSYWAVAKYETGDRVPSSDILARLSEILEVSTDYLLGLTSNPTSPKPQAQQNDLLQTLLKKLPPDMQRFVEEESQHGWPYLRLARGLKMQDLSKEELMAIVDTWMDAKQRYEREKEDGE